MQTLQLHQQDLQAIESAIAHLESLTPGTATTDLAIQSTIESFRLQQIVTQQCIHELTEQELHPRTCQQELDYFYSDGGVYLEEVA